MSTSPAPRREPKPRRHLMTPGQPPRATRQDQERSLTNVQKWVMSTLVVSTILHLAAGLVLAAAYVDPTSSKVGLLVIAGAFGVIAVAAGMLIHQKSLRSPWLALGLLVPLVGWALVF